MGGLAQHCLLLGPCGCVGQHWRSDARSFAATGAEIEAKQMDDGADQPLGLAQSQAEHCRSSHQKNSSGTSTSRSLTEWRCGSTG
jgi:hypothetical protein